MVNACSSSNHYLGGSSASDSGDERPRLARQELQDSLPRSGERLAHLVCREVLRCQHQSPHSSAEEGLAFDGPIADVQVPGDDHPVMLARLREPYLVLAVLGKVIVVEDHTEASCPQGFREASAAKRAVDEEDRLIKPLPCAARSGSLLRSRHGAARSPRPIRRSFRPR